MQVSRMRIDVAGCGAVGAPANGQTLSSRLFAIVTSATVLFALICAFAPAGTISASAQESVVVKALPPAPVDTARVNRIFEDAEKNKSGETFQLYSNKEKSADDTAPPVPMFLPKEIIGDIAKSADKGTDGGDDPVVTLKHGYVATHKFDKFELTLRGTNQVFSDEAPSDKSAAAPEPDYYSGFESTYSGGQVNFGFAGVHYVAEFECNEAKPDSDAECVTEAKAKEILNSLIFCNMDGRCIENGRELIDQK